MQEEDSKARGETRSDREHLQRMHDLGILASKLLRAGPDYDPYEGLNRGHVKITDNTKVEASVQNDFKMHDRFSDRGVYDVEGEAFTPQGFVHNPPEDFQQKIIAIDMKNTHIFAEDDVFNFSSEGHLYLYTDNLSVETPFWEFKDSAAASDIFPSRHRNPYFFHAVPSRIVGEDLALSAVESIARIFATSSREEEADIAARTTAKE